LTPKQTLGIYKIFHIDVTSSMEYALVTFESGLVNLYSIQNNSFDFSFICQVRDHHKNHHDHVNHPCFFVHSDSNTLYLVTLEEENTTLKLYAYKPK
jgi:hypothetical protein